MKIRKISKNCNIFQNYIKATHLQFFPTDFYWIFSQFTAVSKSTGLQL